MAYTLYQVEAASPVVQEVLKSETETAPILLPASGYSSTKGAYEMFDPSILEGDDDPVPTLMKLDGEEKNDDLRAQAIVQEAKLLSLSKQHGEGPLWEKEDGKHRIGELLIAAWDKYCEKHQPNGGEHSDFFKWFDAIPEYDRILMLSKEIKKVGSNVHGFMGQEHFVSREKFKSKDVVPERLMRPSVVKAFARGVKYLDKATRPKYVVSFEGQIAKYRGGAFDTTAMQTVFSGKGYAIWVMDEAGVLYAGNHVYGQMHHSSFLEAGDVVSGGEIRAMNGKIEFLSGKSGHYCPTIQSLINAMKKLETQGIDISAIRVLVWRQSNSKPTIVSAREVVDEGLRSYNAWGGALTGAQRALLQAGEFDKFNS